MSILLGLLHGLDYVFSLFLLGVIIFEILILPAGGEEAVGLDTRALRRIQSLLILTLLSSTAWMVASACDMADFMAPDSKVEELWTAMAHTDFSHLWCVRIALLGVLVLTSRRLLKSRTGRIVLLASVLLIPAFSSLSSHAAAQPSRFSWRIAMDWAHAVAAGIWSGGLFSLWIWLKARVTSSRPFAPKTSHSLVERFSRFAMASTGVIGLSGLLMAYVAGVPLLRPWAAQDYGKLLIGKTLLFSIALLAASINQFLHLRNWRAENEIHFSRSVSREVGLELILVIGIFILAGFLTRSALPGM